MPADPTATAAHQKMTFRPVIDPSRCGAERHIGPWDTKVVVWCDKAPGHKGQHRNEQQGVYWSGNDA